MVRPLERRPDVRLIRAQARIRKRAQTSGSCSGIDRAIRAECMAGNPIAGVLLLGLMPGTALHGLSSGWSDVGPAFACNGSANLLPLRLRRIPRGTTSLAAAVLR